jgi:hypothetical protein
LITIYFLRGRRTEEKKICDDGEEKWKNYRKVWKG